MTPLIHWFMRHDRGVFHLRQRYAGQVLVVYSTNNKQWLNTNDMVIDAKGGLSINGSFVDHLQACSVQILLDGSFGSTYDEPLLLIKTFEKDARIQIKLAAAVATAPKTHTRPPLMLPSSRPPMLALPSLPPAPGDSAHHRQESEHVLEEEDPLAATAAEVLYEVVFLRLLAAFMVWQNLRPLELASKWCLIPKKLNPKADENELLVCRFKVYAPLPHKYRAMGLNVVKDAVRVLSRGATADEWFYAMGSLTTKGIMKIMTELDGKVLYTIDVKNLYQLEIQKTHQLMVNNTSLKVLFLGVLPDLRALNTIRNVQPHPRTLKAVAGSSGAGASTNGTSGLDDDDAAASFLMAGGTKRVPGALRIYVEFAITMDLEDWFVGLNYFAKKELYMLLVFYHQAHALANARSSRLPPQMSILLPQETAYEADAYEDETERKPIPKFRISRRVLVDIIEAQFDKQAVDESLLSARLYCELVIWNIPWFRTAIVANNTLGNPFWKEQFDFENLPLSTQYFQVLVKKALAPLPPPPLAPPHRRGSNFSGRLRADTSLADIEVELVGDKNDEEEEYVYSEDDPVVGTVYITPDLLDGLLQAHETRLNMFDKRLLTVGKLMVRIQIQQDHILLPLRTNFRIFETMLRLLSLQQMVHFVTDDYLQGAGWLALNGEHLEEVLTMFLDIFQLLGREDEWFKCLVDTELVSVVKLLNQKNPTMTNNVFNTFLRGNSVLTKLLEKYNYRLGQEYLEKLLGPFVERVQLENKNCEIDPRALSHIKDDAVRDSMLAENYANLTLYVLELWRLIYTTSNDLPKSIKLQLTQFRLKIDFLVIDTDQYLAKDAKVLLNTLTLFIFLRFFCPVILNPKLFHLTKDHQLGQVQRTLTLVAKVLLTLSNCLRFPPHKEPYLVPLNAFVADHELEVLDYFDKLTGKKNDFNEKVLELLDELARFDLNLVGDSENNADYLTNELLPMTPFLIDKYLRFAQLIRMLTFAEDLDDGTGGKRVSNSSGTTLETTGRRDQLGDLPFELDDLETFLRLMLHLNENLLQYLHTLGNIINIVDLQDQARVIRRKTALLRHELGDRENLHHKFRGKRAPPMSRSSPLTEIDDDMWGNFVDSVWHTAHIDPSLRCVVYCEPGSAGDNLAPVAKEGLAPLKIHFPEALTPATTAILAAPPSNAPLNRRLMTLKGGHQKKELRRSFLSMFKKK